MLAERPKPKKTSMARRVQHYEAVDGDESEQRSLLGGGGASDSSDLGIAIEMRDPESTDAGAIGGHIAVARPVGGNAADDSLFTRSARESTHAGAKFACVDRSQPLIAKPVLADGRSARELGEGLFIGDAKSESKLSAPPDYSSLYQPQQEAQSASSSSFGASSSSSVSAYPAIDHKPSAPPFAGLAPLAQAVPVAAETLVQVVLPPGAHPGQQIAVAHPQTGFQSILTVPPGVAPGQAINVQLPSGSFTNDPRQQQQQQQRRPVVVEGKYDDGAMEKEKEREAATEKKRRGYTPATYKSIYDTDTSSSRTGLDSKDAGYQVSEYKPSEYKSIYDT